MGSPMPWPDIPVAPGPFRAPRDREWAEREAVATLEQILRDHGPEWLVLTVLGLVGSQALGRSR